MKILIVVWYLVGIAGFLILPLQGWFQLLTPFGMLAATALLMVFHEPKTLKTGLFFGGIALLGFIAEVVGVNFQVLFGFYRYGSTLGPKLWETPVIIGLNWLVLVYCIASITRRLRDNWFFPLISAALMVVFD